MVEMGTDSADQNAADIQSGIQQLAQEFKWIEKLIRYRIDEMCEVVEVLEVPAPPDLEDINHPYLKWLHKMDLDLPERVATSLALIAYTAPQYLDHLYIKNQLTGQVFTEFGVRFEGDPLRVSPSWQTALFLSPGVHTDQQFEALKYVHPESQLYKYDCLKLPEERTENPFFMPLHLNNDLMRAWLYPEDLRNVADRNFPAHEISSDLSWDDLFLNKETIDGIKQLKLWLTHGKDLMNDEKFSKYISPGIRVLFYGPSGTGKTLTASLLGKEFQMPVYRVDLSQMVSKWIGETEKNLARVFDIAEKQKWVLFFDEADALFSKRSSVNSSNDRRANQEISYLLQRIENYDGTVIMASNLRDNIDEAFVRRFQLMIEFPMPDKTIRKKLWTSMLTGTFDFSGDLDLAKIAAEFEMTGGSMKNAFRALMLTLSDSKESVPLITDANLRKVIQLEQSKLGIYSIKKRF
jgi:AAA+ superfamily predicted ATPase